MLYQLSYFRKTHRKEFPLPDRLGNTGNPFGALFEWEVMDSNHRRRKPADLQSVPFGHSGNFPYVSKPLSLNSTVSAPQGFLEPMEGFEPPTS